MVTGSRLLTGAMVAIVMLANLAGVPFWTALFIGMGLAAIGGAIGVALRGQPRPAQPDGQPKNQPGGWGPTFGVGLSTLGPIAWLGIRRK